MLKYIFLSSSTNVKRRATCFSFFGVLLTLFFLLTACGESSAPDSKQLLTQAQSAMTQVNSYHFTLSTDHPGSGNGSDINIQAGSGDVLAPNKIKATGTVSYQGFPLSNVSIIAIGQQDYYQQAFLTGGSWMQISGFDASKLADPQTGIGALIGSIQQPGTATDSSVDNNSCWSVTGQLGTQYIAGIIGSSTATSGNVAVTVCIGKSDHRPYQIQIKGIVIQGDSDQSTRTIKFSNFGETITINAPI